MEASGEPAKAPPLLQWETGPGGLGDWPQAAQAVLGPPNRELT